jgi:hypothetical protein
MKKLKTNLMKIVIASFAVVLIFNFQSTIAQDENDAITVYMYRRVEQGKMNEVIERETKYWSKVAQKEIDEGRLLFWAVLQKVGGIDIENSSNILIINTYADIDDMEGMWDASAVFPDVPMEDMETSSMFTTTSILFVLTQSFILKETENPMEDFKYVGMVYHNADNPTDLIVAENEIWGPFIKSAWENGKVNQTGWGNAIILSPTGDEVKYNTISFDIFPSLKEVLIPTWAEDLEMPDMTRIGETEGDNRRATAVYQIVQSLMAD